MSRLTKALDYFSYTLEEIPRRPEIKRSLLLFYLCSLLSGAIAAGLISLLLIHANRSFLTFFLIGVVVALLLLTLQFFSVLLSGSVIRSSASESQVGHASTTIRTERMVELFKYTLAKPFLQGNLSTNSNVNLLPAPDLKAWKAGKSLFLAELVLNSEDLTTARQKVIQQASVPSLQFDPQEVNLTPLALALPLLFGLIGCTLGVLLGSYLGSGIKVSDNLQLRAAFEGMAVFLVFFLPAVSFSAITQGMYQGELYQLEHQPARTETTP